MASQYPCVKNHASGFIFYVGLVSQADTKLLKSSPTLAAGDFKVSIDGGALANLGTLPTVTPASGRMVKITLAQAEINGDNITVVCNDAAGAEWCDLIINIQTVPRRFDDLAYPATSGRSIVVDANGLVDANTVKVGPTGTGTAQTARDVGASVLLSSGTGTGQLDFTSGVVKANLAQILGTALTETAGLIAAGFKKFFNVATPTGTVNSLPDAVAGAEYKYDTRNPVQYFDPAAFALPPGYRPADQTALGGTFIGNATRSIPSAPGIAKFDLVLVKSTALTERVNLQFRSEFFNLFNRANFGLPAGRIFADNKGTISGSVGRITETSTISRQIQFGLRLVF